jgi:hypothetical protein
MKVLITENKLFDSIYSYIDGDFNKDDIHWTYGTSMEEWGDNFEDENYLIFYNGDWEGEEDSDVVFMYFDEEYYSDAPSAQPHKDKAPTLEVMEEYGKHLDTMFGNHWKEPMKKWFEDNYSLPVKTIVSD